MVKKIVQDIVKPRKIMKPKIEKKAIVPPVPPVSPEIVNTDPYREFRLQSLRSKASMHDTLSTEDGIHNEGSGNKNGSKIGLWTVATVSFLILLFSVSPLFIGATFTVTPIVKDFAIQNNFTAIKDSEDNLSFEVMSITDEERQILKATEARNVEKKAIGKVMIYNSFSSSPQKLLIDTRLEAPSGKIYKTDKEVIVPGYTTKNKETIPGSIEVGIHADQAGDEYNSDPVDFSIVGFKSSPKYTKIYARSKGNITGGFTGLANVISESEAGKIQESLKLKLKEKLMQKIKAEVPKDFVLFDDAIFLNLDSDTVSTEFKESEVPVIQNGTIYALIFDKSKLVQSISSSVMREPVNDVIISNISELVFEMKNKSLISPESITEISFNLSGQARFIWPVDEGKIKSDLSGKKKKEFKIILSSFPNVDQAEVVIKPFWKSSFPSDIDKIKVVNKAK